MRRVHVVDTVGAGDNCTAGFIAALLAGAPLQAAIECGCAAGTAAVQSAGGCAERWGRKQTRSESRRHHIELRQTVLTHMSLCVCVRVFQGAIGT